MQMLERLIHSEVHTTSKDSPYYNVS